MVEMKYTKFVLNKIFGTKAPVDTPTKIPVYTERITTVLPATLPYTLVDKVSTRTEVPSSGMGVSSIAGIAVASMVFLIVLTVYGSIQSTLNTSVFSAGTANLINLIPLVLVGAAIIGIIVTAMVLTN